ncbi:SH3 domain-containing protein [Shimia sp. W99]|uniref:SH3-like domain-containing protein n=1 Tax=Shimia aestuarii TaxID=254406 RepID=A0A1I4J826_9RHOB|nr:SH3 domain-containing protein [Shimia aestuarii]SFL62323.1 SH3-like domain-containing protein [Shimia aestuarii]
MGRKTLFCIVAAGVLAVAGAVVAETARGPVTNLPLPRFVSLKASKANVRRGPSLTHRIDWVFKRKNMPLEITAEYGHWRRVRDIEGAGGWVHYSLLSGARTVIVEHDMLPLAMRPEANTPAVAHLELGVVARLGECGPDWCYLNAAGYKGWAQKAHLWGVTPDELRD